MKNWQWAGIIWAIFMAGYLATDEFGFIVYSTIFAGIGMYNYLKESNDKKV